MYIGSTVKAYLLVSDAYLMYINQCSYCYECGTYRWCTGAEADGCVNYLFLIAEGIYFLTVWETRGTEDNNRGAAQACDE